MRKFVLAFLIVILACFSAGITWADLETFSFTSTYFTDWEDDYGGTCPQPYSKGSGSSYTSNLNCNDSALVGHGEGDSDSFYIRNKTVTGSSPYDSELIIASFREDGTSWVYDPSEKGEISSGNATFYVWFKDADPELDVSATAHVYIRQEVGESYEHFISNDDYTTVDCDTDGCSSVWGQVQMTNFLESKFDKVTSNGIDDTKHPTFDETGGAMDFGFAIDFEWDDVELPEAELLTKFYVDDYEIHLSTPDTDEDEVGDFEDNCSEKPNGEDEDPMDQTDDDSDGFGDACDGDFDNDNLCDGDDYLMLGGNFGEDVPPAPADVDMDDNLLIDGGDILLFNQCFGKAPGPACGNARGTPCD